MNTPQCVLLYLSGTSEQGGSRSQPASRTQAVREDTERRLPHPERAVSVCTRLNRVRSTRGSHLDQGAYSARGDSTVCWRGCARHQ